MTARARARIEPLGLIGAALAIDYVWLTRQQGNLPLPWVLALLLAGALLAAYGAVRELPYRRAALLAAAGALTTLGLLRLFFRVADHRCRSPGPGLALARTPTPSAVGAASLRTAAG